MIDINLQTAHRMLVTLPDGPRVLIGKASDIGNRVNELNNKPRARVNLAELQGEAPLPEGVPVEIVSPIRKSSEGGHGLRERR